MRAVAPCNGLLSSGSLCSPADIWSHALDSGEAKFVTENELSAEWLESLRADAFLQNAASSLRSTANAPMPPMNVIAPLCTSGRREFRRDLHAGRGECRDATRAEF